MRVNIATAMLVALLSVGCATPTGGQHRESPEERAEREEAEARRRMDTPEGREAARREAEEKARLAAEVAARDEAARIQREEERKKAAEAKRLADEAARARLKEEMQIKTPFDEEAFKPFEGKGTASLTGQAFLLTRGGDAKKASGKTVYLYPLIPYTAEYMDRYILRGEFLDENPRMYHYRRETTADVDGRFAFSDLPAGDYFAYCKIQWEVPGKYGPETTGGFASATFTLEDGKETKAILK